MLPGPRNRSRLSSRYRSFLLILLSTCVLVPFVSLNRIVIQRKFNEHNRVSHAREVLGTTYHASHIRLVEALNDLEGAVRGVVEDQLPHQWRSHRDGLIQAIVDESDRYGLDPIFILAIIKTESRFRPDAKGRHGEIGLMQIRPDTAKWMAEKNDLEWLGPQKLQDPIYNVQIGVAYLAYLRRSFKQRPVYYISAYNMGPRNVRDLASQDIEPKIYSLQIIKNYRELYQLILEEHSVQFAKADRNSDSD